MTDLKVNHNGTLKTPERVFTKGYSGTLYQVNYVVANNASQSPVTVWNAVFTTARSTTTTFDTNRSTATAFTTTFSTTGSTTTTFCSYLLY